MQVSSVEELASRQLFSFKTVSVEGELSTIFSGLHTSLFFPDIGEGPISAAFTSRLQCYWIQGYEKKYSLPEK